MEIVTTKQGPVTIVAPPGGRLDSATAKTFEDDLLARVSAGSCALVVDFARLDYISSAGLRVILMAAKRVKAAQAAPLQGGQEER